MNDRDYIDPAGQFSVDRLLVLNGESTNDDQNDCICDNDEFKDCSNGSVASSLVHRKIADCLTRRSVTLDLSRQSLQELPEEVLDLQHIQV
jgi:hypothetical protein